MPPYVLGQRFVSDAEPELGLGRVEHIEKRSPVLRFPASDTLRRYASGGAPIRRVALAETRMKRTEKAISAAELRLDCLRLIWLEPSRP